MKKLIVIGSLVSTLFLAAAPALALTDNSSTGGTANQTQVTTNNADKAAIRACRKATRDKRDQALKTARENYAAARKAARAAHQTALLAARQLTDKQARRDAIRKANQDFRDAIKKAREDWLNARRAANEQFRTDYKACKPTTGTSR